MTLEQLHRTGFMHAAADGGDLGGGGGPAPEAESAPAAEPAPEAESAPAAEPAAGDWRAALPDELRDNASLADVKDIAGLAKRFVDTKAMVGQALRVPGPDAGAEAMAEFRQSLLDKNLGLVSIPDADDVEGMAAVYKALGAPDEASAYSRPEKWEGMTDERYGTLSSVALEAGVTRKQFETIASKLAEADNTTIGAMEQQFQGDMDQLKGEWGNAYAQKVGRAAVVAKQLEAPEGLQAALADGTAGAETLRWLDKVAAKFGGEGSALVTETGQVSEFTPSEAKEQLSEITKRMLSMDPNDPQFKPLLDKRLKIATMLNPT